MNDLPTSVISIAILIFSAALHEVAHGATALYFGDKTALRAGRLTLNPFTHIDLFGSVLLPLGLVFIGSPFVFGWAKPVPVNPAAMNKKWAHAVVALAGPVTNIVLAATVGIILQVWGTDMPTGFAQFLVLTVMINVVLALFNLIPVPPLDGFHIAAYVLRLPRRVYDFCVQYSFVMIIIAVLVFHRFFDTAIITLVRLFTGAGV